MIYSSRTQRPNIHADAYVAPSATICGDVTIAAGCAILHGAILVAEGAPLRIDQESVVMENAVLRSSGGSATTFALHLGARCIVGPQAYVVGATIGRGCFIASGAKVFNGATMEEGSSLALGAILHVGSRLPSGTHVPMQHIAFGDPADILPPERAGEVHARLHFFETVFNLETSSDVRARAAGIYAAFLRKAHAQDAAIEGTLRTTKPVTRRPAGEEPPPQQQADVGKVVDVMMLELEEMERRREEAIRRQRRGGKP
ncbi:MAG: gamma carbonic anhydrase family protein [Vulcanimicrobiaceae bacterium]